MIQADHSGCQTKNTLNQEAVDQLVGDWWYRLGLSTGAKVRGQWDTFRPPLSQVSAKVRLDVITLWGPGRPQPPVRSQSVGDRWPSGDVAGPCA